MSPTTTDRVFQMLPTRVRNRLEGCIDAVDVLSESRDPRVLRSLVPSGIRGLILQRAKRGVPTLVPSHHSVHFDWSYPNDHPKMRELYRRAKRAQWDADTDVPWNVSVDPFDTDKPILPDDYFEVERLEEARVPLSPHEKNQLRYSLVAWMLSQFLHGEQGALVAAAQVTEAVPFFDGKLYGSTQVVDEGRHVEVFHRYLHEKLGKVYPINDNLYVIIDALVSDSRWDMKFLGMQIMVEGLALGAFGALYRMTQEPLLKYVLKRVIQDEARHVHYGVLALRDHFQNNLTDTELREREDWAFEVALLMRNRFMADEVYEEFYAGSMPRSAWREFVSKSKGMTEFRTVMFNRLVPNLRSIGLMPARMRAKYSRAGLMRFYDGASADELTDERILSELDHVGA